MCTAICACGTNGGALGDIFSIKNAHFLWKNSIKCSKQDKSENILNNFKIQFHISLIRYKLKGRPNVN